MMRVLIWFFCFFPPLLVSSYTIDGRQGSRLSSSKLEVPPLPTVPPESPALPPDEASVPGQAQTDPGSSDPPKAPAGPPLSWVWPPTSMVPAVIGEGPDQYDIDNVSDADLIKLINSKLDSLVKKQTPGIQEVKTSWQLMKDELSKGASVRAMLQSFAEGALQIWTLVQKAGGMPPAQIALSIAQTVLGWAGSIASAASAATAWMPFVSLGITVVSSFVSFFTQMFGPSPPPPLTKEVLREVFKETLWEFFAEQQKTTLEIKYDMYMTVMSQLTNVTAQKTITEGECNVYMDSISLWQGRVMSDTEALEKFWGVVQEKVEAAMKQLPSEKERPCVNWCALPSIPLEIWAYTQARSRASAATSMQPFDSCVNLNGYKEKGWMTQEMPCDYGEWNSRRGRCEMSYYTPCWDRLNENVNWRQGQHSGVSCCTAVDEARKKHEELLPWVSTAMMMSQAHLLFVLAAKKFFKTVRVRNADSWFSMEKEKLCVDVNQKDGRTIVKLIAQIAERNLFRLQTWSPERAEIFTHNNKTYHCERPQIEVLKWPSAQNQTDAVPQFTGSWRNVSARWDWLELVGGEAGGYFPEKVTLENGHVQEVFHLNNSPCYPPEDQGMSVCDPPHSCWSNTPHCATHYMFDGIPTAGGRCMNETYHRHNKLNYTWAGPSFNWTNMMGPQSVPPGFDIMEAIWPAADN
uniref:C-type lectin domain-containing protein n=1 Tax=Chromera velia CCMP2878 TaxID=1169474 RepID=A0A0G4GQM3_9ALVE|eukprot:Cvel_5055.t1-p1 / transcript=Cvel_5055.t1 / gene=Cvel_5055 / organism=Chromera_velia_CCMP2878 / gene_product=hypothetical protein / transcript_product=hypothetical protein / location=Cvel_scaffold230:61975-66255(+) / protein_length=688 / sequence_SO=supercontig / SO=protein_coding / is_pseudo=false